MATITFYRPDNSEHSWCLEDTGAMPDYPIFVEEVARSIAARCIAAQTYTQIILSFKDDLMRQGFQSWREIRFYPGPQLELYEEVSTVTQSVLP